MTACPATRLLAAARHAPLPNKTQFSGHLVPRWGLFNLVEGLIDNRLPDLQHVRDIPVHMPLYDWLFLGIGGVVVHHCWLDALRVPKYGGCALKCPDRADPSLTASRLR